MPIRQETGRTNLAARDRPFRISLSLILWLIAIGGLCCADLAFLEPRQMQVAISTVGLAHSVTGFWVDGGKRITAPGVFFFASSLFVYFPGIYLAITPTAKFYALNLTLAVLLVLLMQVLSYRLAWQGRREPALDAVNEISSRLSRPIIILGICFLGIGSLASFSPLGDNPLVDALVYAGLVLYAVAALHRNRRTVVAYLAIAAGFLLYLEVIFTGFGRLTLGSLGIALAMAATHRWRGRLVKIALLLGSVPVITYMAIERVMLRTPTVSTADSAITGLESVMSPLARFSQLLHMSMSGELDYTWGHSLIASAVVLIPRGLWPDKPVGLGAELGAMFGSDLADNYTALALVYGEAVYGFGVVGLLLLFPVLAWLVRRVDGIIVKSQRRQAKRVSDLVLTTGGIVIAASIVDLVWGGSFTFASGIAPRLVIILMAYVGARCLEGMAATKLRSRDYNIRRR